MKAITAFFKLIRYQNLLIIILTQTLMRYLVLKPLLNYHNLKLQIDTFHFVLLMLSTVFITAAGYVINDYFDRKTDMVNRPDTVVIGKIINRRWAMALHLVFNFIGVGLGTYLCFYIKVPYLSVIFLIIVGLLWFYSTTYKRQFLLGNLMVAFLTALVPIMVGLFEVPLLNVEYAYYIINYKINFKYVLISTSGFACFAFITTLIREIIKDAEDFEGDAAYGRNSVPIVLGMKNTKIILYSLIVITLSALVFSIVQFLHIDKSGSFILISVVYTSVLAALYIFLGIKLFLAETKKHFHFTSLFTKIIMLAGLGYSVVIFIFFR
jgi:4-hydroxybenzoate polyprenyltransferase